MSSLELRAVRVSRGERQVLDGIDLRLESGEIVALLGPSGCGKSTLLAAIAGLLPLDSGRIALDGIEIVDTPTHRRAIGLVPQGDHLFTHLDVSGNIAYGLRRARWEPEARTERVNSLLELIGMPEFAHRRVDELSGGQAKRVALARAVAPRPKLILLDEPLTGLDSHLHDRLMRDLVSLLRAEGMTAIWVTHDRAEAAGTADRIVMMDDSGRLADSDTAVRPHVVASIAARATHDLRRRVLRNHTPSDDVRFDGDDEALHLGVTRDGQIVAVSSWYQRSHQGAAGGRGMQLRGMASDPDFRGIGAGAALLESGAATAAALGCDHVWARARDTALGFYLQHGFVVIGDGYVDSTTQLPHHDIIRHL